jgi:hypothetical protein
MLRASPYSSEQFVRIEPNIHVKTEAFWIGMTLAAGQLQHAEPNDGLRLNQTAAGNSKIL